MSAQLNDSLGADRGGGIVGMRPFLLAHFPLPFILPSHPHPCPLTESACRYVVEILPIEIMGVAQVRQAGWLAVERPGWGMQHHGCCGAAQVPWC